MKSPTRILGIGKKTYYPSEEIIKKCLESASLAPHYSQKIPSSLKSPKSIFESLPYMTPMELSDNPTDFIPRNLDRDSLISYQSSGFSQKAKQIYLTDRDISQHATHLEKLLRDFTDFDSKAHTLVIAPLNTGRVASFFAESLLPKFSKNYGTINMFDEKQITKVLSASKYAQVFIPLPVLVNLVNQSEKEDIEVSKWDIQRFYVGGVPVPTTIRNRVREIFNSKISCLYGMSEVGSAISCDSCIDGGMHFMPQEYIGWELAEDSKISHKELVVTNFQRDGSQIVKYKTGDIVKDITSLCKHKPKLPMLKWIVRKDNMVPMGQMNLWWDSNMDEAVFSLSGVRDYRLLLTHSSSGLDHLLFKIDSEKPISREKIIEDVLKNDEELYTQINTNFIEVSTEPLTEEDLNNVSFKFRRFIDVRKI